MPKRFVFISVPDRGHIFPHLVVAKELIRRGHSVDFVTTRHLADLVESYGLRALRYESAYETMPADAEKADMDQEAAMLALSVDDNAAMIDAVEAAYGDDRPDLVAYDFASSTAGRVLARKWGLPAAQLYAVFAQNDEFAYTQSFGDDGVADRKPLSPQEWAEQPALRPWVDRTAQLLARHGLDVTFAELMEVVQDFSVVYVPKALQPAADSFDERFVFVGPCVDDREPLGGWERPADDLPIALVSLGTLFNQDPEFFRTCVRAFTDVPVHVVMTLGDGVDPAELGELPPNIEAHRWVSHVAVLKHAAVMVTHGGVSSVSDALSAGCPVVVVPVGPVAKVTGIQIDKLGLGRMVPEHAFGADELRRTVLGLVDDPDVARNLERMRREVEEAGGAPRAADELEAYLREHGG